MAHMKGGGTETVSLEIKGSINLILAEVEGNISALD